MEGSTWILLISVPLLVVMIYFVRRKHQYRGIGLFGAVCPRCASRLSKDREAASFWEAVSGGWTCQKCGCKIDKYGRERAS